jgi:hypothetical protein
MMEDHTTNELIEKAEELEDEGRVVDAISYWRAAYDRDPDFDHLVSNWQSCEEVGPG